MAFDCETFQAENNNAVNQTLPVFMLGGPLGNFDMDVTIPRNKPIMAPIVTFLNDYPCPDPAFEPAPGQTLEEFLQAGAAEAIDLVTSVSATLDGIVLDDVDTYRFSTGLFAFTGHPSLADCADPCVTGSPQDAVADGYFLLLKKLSPGLHTLHLTAEIPAFGLVHSGTFNITVE
jgi:hypothetical protein